MKSLVERLRVCTYMELEAMKLVYSVSEGRDEYTFNASVLTEGAKVGKSAMVAALKLFEVAGVVESRSLGRRGTFVRILDRKTIEEVLNG